MEFIGPKTKYETLIEEYPVSSCYGEPGPGNWRYQDDYESYLAHKKWLDSVNKCRHIGETKYLYTDSQGDPLYVWCDKCIGNF